MKIYLPEQDLPSEPNVYPDPQPQVKLPTVLMHVWVHPPLLVKHSLTSERKNDFVAERKLETVGLELQWISA
jgi:hypothetical protein